MALFDPSELKAWRYCVHTCVVMVNGQTITLDPMNVTGIEIHNDYYGNIFPIFKINFLLDEKDYYTILSNKTSVKIKLRIQKYSKKYQNGKASFKQDYINGTFVTIEDDNDVDRSVDLDLSDKINKASSDTALEKFDTALELYLYREETATGIKKQINNIFQNVTMSSVIGYLFGESGIKNALVSPLENNKTYKTLLLPPMTVNKMLCHLDASYGFYKKGSVIFFGIDRTYILNFKGGCTAYEIGEKQETCIYVPKLLSTGNAAGGTIDGDGSRHYINWKYEQVNFKNSSVSKDVLSGSDVLVVNPTTNDKTEATSKTTVMGKSNTAILDDEASNPWLATTFTAQTSSNALIIYGAMADVDISALTPNKKFSIVFEDQKLTSKYKGTYFLSNCMFKFVNDSAEGDFSMIASVELRRIQ